MLDYETEGGARSSSEYEISSANHSEHGDEYACIWLRRLLSGMPNLERQRRWWLMLQVFVDDSGRGENADNPVFLLAGYVGRVQNWEAAADDIQRIMRRRPRLEYLKGKEAAALNGNFKGWSAEQRDERLCEMIAILRKYRMIAISFAVSYRAFNRIMAEPRGIHTHPYALAFSNVVVWVLSSAFKKKSRERIELIFDQGVLQRERNINAAYKGMMDFVPKELTDLLVGRPRFENDRDFLPLQMADLFAWHSRRDYYEQIASNGKQRLESKVWDELRTIQGKALYFRAADLIDFKLGIDARRGAYGTARSAKTAL